MEIIQLSEEEAHRLRKLNPTLDSLGESIWIFDGMIFGKGGYDILQEAIKKEANKALIKKLPRARKFFDIR